jgi:hypothetical protein
VFGTPSFLDQVVPLGWHDARVTDGATGPIAASDGVHCLAGYTAMYRVQGADIAAASAGVARKPHHRERRSIATRGEALRLTQLHQGQRQAQGAR